jgi:hypothetical protein
VGVTEGWETEWEMPGQAKANLHAGYKPARVTSVTSTQTFRPMSQIQGDFIASLIAERGGKEAAAVQPTRAFLNGHAKAGTLSTSIASQAIDALKAIPKPVAPAPDLFTSAAQVAPKVMDPYAGIPEGNYALETPEAKEPVTFYRVSHPDWAKVTQVQVYSSDEKHYQKGEARKNVLQRIAEDTKAAAALYGFKMKRCWKCHRKLTVEASQIRGMGETCAKNEGWL